LHVLQLKLQLNPNDHYSKM